MSMPKGLDDLAVEKSLREITAATADILAPLMVRIGIYESDPEKIYEGGKCRGHLPPTVVFNCGPGRSPGGQEHADELGDGDPQRKLGVRQAGRSMPPAGQMGRLPFDD